VEGEAAAEGVVEGDTDTRVAARSPGSRLTALPAGEIRRSARVTTIKT